MTKPLPPENSDPLLTPTHTPTYSDWTLYTALYKHWGINLNKAEQHVNELNESGRAELCRRVRAARLNKQ